MPKANFHHRRLQANLRNSPNNDHSRQIPGPSHASPSSDTHVDNNLPPIHGTRRDDLRQIQSANDYVRIQGQDQSVAFVVRRT